MEHIKSVSNWLLGRKKETIEQYITGNINNDVAVLLDNGYSITYEIPRVPFSRDQKVLLRHHSQIIFINRNKDFNMKFHMTYIKQDSDINRKIFATIDYYNRDLSKLNMTKFKNNAIIRHYYNMIALPRVVYN